MTGSGRPFTTAILKLTAVCNLNCSYCYVFNLADRTHSRVPALMAQDTAILAVRAMAAHVRARGSGRVNIVLHGGEPALWPLDRFRELFAEVEEVRRTGLEVDLSLQTNGLRLRRDLVELLDAHGATLGFSLDGPQPVNDRYRVTHSGEGSYSRVMTTLSQVLDWGFDRRRIGVLSVSDPALQPDHYLAWAAELPIQNVSLLWPIEFSWSNPPWGDGDEADYAREPRYGSWMAAVFEHWWAHYSDRLYVRQFVETIGRLMGSRRHSDSIGNDAVDMLVVNTDGAVEYPDYLRAHRDGGSRTPFTIEDDLDTVATDPTFGTLLRLRDHLPQACRRCPYEDVCGGGFLAGRSIAGNFEADRLSVLCHDQYRYFERVAAAVRPYVEALDNEFSPPMARL